MENGRTVTVVCHDNELYHHGIQGQKWGVRRYQNKDGSLTSAGRKRYGDGGENGTFIKKVKDKYVARKKEKEAEKKKKARLEAMKKGREAKKKQQEEEVKKQADREAEKKRVLETRSAKELYDNAHLFTSEELSVAYQRLILERNISNLAPKPEAKAAEVVDKILKAGKTIDEAAKTGTNLYNHVARLHNTFSSGDKMPVIKDNDKEDKKKVDFNIGEKLKVKNNQNDNQNNNQNNNNQNNNQNKNKNKDKGTPNNSQQTKNNDKREEEKVETFTGTVHGEGTSRSNLKNASDWVKSKSDDWDVAAHTPATRESGEAYANRLLANEDEYLRRFLN